MAGYNQLKASIASVIKTNNAREITGQLLQNVLNQMVSVIGENLQLAGFADPTTNPGQPDQNIFYIAEQEGVYSHFNNTVLEGGLSFLMWKDGNWSSHTMQVVTDEYIKNHYVSIDFFRSIFRVYDENGNEILPNNEPDPILGTQEVIDNIKAQVGLWTEYYLSALGRATGGGGGGGATSLDELSDVTINTNTLANGQALVYNSTTQMWENQTIQAGTDMASVWTALAASTNEQINISHLTGALQDYLTQTSADQRYITIAYFDRLFRAYNGSTLVSHNDTTTTIDNIKAMFGFWTDMYLSALGRNSAATGLGIDNLTDVTINTPTAGQVLQYNANSSRWENATIQTVVALAGLTDVLLTNVANEDFLKYDSTTQKWVNTTMKTINGQSLIGSGDISVGGGASGNYLPLTGGTLTGSLQIYSTGSSYNEGVRVHVTGNGGWCGFVMCGSDNTGNTGTTTKTWSIHNHDGVFSLGNDGADNPDVGLNWVRREDLQISTVQGKVVTVKSSDSNTYIMFKTGSTNRSSAGYYNGMSFIANENNYHRIGVLNDGTPVYRKGGGTSDDQYKLLHGGESIELWATGSSYSEGIRIHPASNNWCGLILCGSNNTGHTGTSSTTWGVFNNNGTFYINRDAAESQTAQVLCCTGTNWGIGVTSPSYKLHVSGTIYATDAITALSDMRDKLVNEEAKLPIEWIANAPAFSYYWKDKKAHDELLHVGSSAQYWRTVLPEVVLEAKDEKGTLSMQYGVAALVSAITIARKVVDHERRIKALECKAPN